MEEKRAPWYGPEYMFTVYIAQEIRRLKSPPYVDVEDYVYGALYDAGGLQGRIPRGLRVEGKYDLCLSDNHDHPYAVIEVKFAYGFANVSDDFYRICYTLNRGSEVKRGYLCAIVSGQSENRTGLLEDRIKQIKSEVNLNSSFDNRERNIKTAVKHVTLHDGRAYAALVFEISND